LFQLHTITAFKTGLFSLFSDYFSYKEIFVMNELSLLNSYYARS